MAAPTVTGVAPAVGPLTGGTSVVITGTHFTDAGAMSAVLFGASVATKFTVNSNTSATAIAPAHVPGTVDITVTTPGGTSATGAPDEFTYQPTVATQVPGVPGAVITEQAANALGDSFLNDGRTEFRVNNAGIGACTVTVLGKQLCSQGHLHNQVVVVGAGTEETIGAFSTAQFTDPATGLVDVTYDEVTTVTVAAVRIA